jgi:1,2-phenylacetyl-CoA epoxidase catalytic subunit
MEDAIDDLWPYTGELFIAADFETAANEFGIGPDVSTLKTFLGK